MDGIGYLSYIIPAVGELTDIIWAPVSAFVMYKMYGGKEAVAGSLMQFVEEIIPGTDFIPSFTITWLWAFVIKGKQ